MWLLYRLTSDGHTEGTKGSGVSRVFSTMSAAARDVVIRSRFKDSFNFSFNCSIRRNLSIKIRSSISALCNMLAVVQIWWMGNRSADNVDQYWWLDVDKLDRKQFYFRLHHPISASFQVGVAPVPCRTLVLLHQV